ARGGARSARRARGRRKGAPESSDGPRAIVSGSRGGGKQLVQAGVDAGRRVEGPLDEPVEIRALRRGAAAERRIGGKTIQTVGPGRRRTGRILDLPVAIA